MPYIILNSPLTMADSLNREPIAEQSWCRVLQSRMPKYTCPFIILRLAFAIVSQMFQRSFFEIPRVPPAAPCQRLALPQALTTVLKLTTVAWSGARPKSRTSVKDSLVIRFQCFSMLFIAFLSCVFRLNYSGISCCSCAAWTAPLCHRNYHLHRFGTGELTTFKGFGSIVFVSIKLLTATSRLCSNISLWVFDIQSATSNCEKLRVSQVQGSLPLPLLSAPLCTQDFPGATDSNSNRIS
jgi:hypothetical protein